MSLIRRTRDGDGWRERETGGGAAEKKTTGLLQCETNFEQSAGVLPLTLSSLLLIGILHKLERAAAKSVLSIKSLARDSAYSNGKYSCSNRPAAV